MNLYFAFLNNFVHRRWSRWLVGERTFEHFFLLFVSFLRSKSRAHAGFCPLHLFRCDEVDDSLFFFSRKKPVFDTFCRTSGTSTCTSTVERVSKMRRTGTHTFIV